MVLILYLFYRTYILKGVYTMDKLDINLLKKIELALGLKFKEWQINYMLDIPMVLDMKITGRGTGKTLVYTIKMLFSDDIPIRVYKNKEIANISDWFCMSDRINPHYVKWYRDYLIETYGLLIQKGMTPRQLVFKEEELKLGDDLIFKYLDAKQIMKGEL